MESKSPRMTHGNRGRTPPQWKNYWLLYLDLAGFAQRVRESSERQKLAAVYSQFVDIAVLWAPPVTRKFEQFDLTLRDVERVREDGIAAIDGRLRDSDARSVRESIAIWRDRVHVFSDSVFVFFDCHEHRDTLTAEHANLVETAAHMSSALWAREIPHKGAISYGECYVHDRVCLGMPIVSGHAWEKNQEWLGISVSPESMEEAKAAGFLARGPLEHGLFEHEVPTNDPAGSQIAYCVDVPRFVSGIRRSGRGSVREPSFAVVVDGLGKAAGSVATGDSKSEKLKRRYRATATIWQASRACDGAEQSVRDALGEIIRSCTSAATK